VLFMLLLFMVLESTSVESPVELPSLLLLQAARVPAIAKTIKNFFIVLLGLVNYWPQRYKVR
jgi:hypothetical protein